MPNKKITSLTELSAAPATNDLVPIVDVSDTTDSANGTTKKLTVTNLFTTPTIASFTNATHNHTNAPGGGQLTDSALSSAIGIAKGGTGQTTATEAFDALAPTTTVGDMIYHNGSDNIRLAKGTAGQVLAMNSTATAPEWTNTLYPEQNIGIKAATSSTTDGFCFASNTAGTVFFMAEKSSGASTNWNIYRLLKDSATGQFYITHSTTLSTGNTQFGMAVAGNYLYVSCYIAATNSLRRYDVADLANVTSMTFSGTSRVGGMFSNNTDIYILNTGDTMTKFTISGTTATNAGDVTYTSGITAGDSGYACDGTNVWLSGAGSGFNTSGTVIIKKYPLAGGTATASTTFILNNAAWYGIASGGSCSMGMFLNGSSTLGLAWNWRQVSPTAEAGILAHLMFISKP